MREEGARGPLPLTAFASIRSRLPLSLLVPSDRGCHPAVLISSLPNWSGRAGPLGSQSRSNSGPASSVRSARTTSSFRLAPAFRALHFPFRPSARQPLGVFATQLVSLRCRFARRQRASTQPRIPVIAVEASTVSVLTQYTEYSGARHLTARRRFSWGRDSKAPPLRSAYVARHRLAGLDCPVHASPHCWGARGSLFPV